ncbi:hypothetical protein Tco_0959771 [Tanacetum coccineum]
MVDFPTQATYVAGEKRAGERGFCCSDPSRQCNIKLVMRENIVRQIDTRIWNCLAMSFIDSHRKAKVHMEVFSLKFEREHVFFRWSKRNSRTKVVRVAFCSMKFSTIGGDMSSSSSSSEMISSQIQLTKLGLKSGLGLRANEMDM